ncbi:DUF2207 domain-containing protein [endosymbiont GvMRE of Glomus versiforme]|uniref:DUF2207 domain-containing protein n=1 Tax=endosymbiont GvMRE of Glomus versiforme TaxID=2039283 RepID=UPI000EC19D8D|nr:DUF2207 domain-containing protein [endosymbiont GvMRE of Glomus versiforme]RHZ35992.1 hypothetical protein GvMRE_Ic3g33 [endosymbiont GvMRE of Glomus versiforme]
MNEKNLFDLLKKDLENDLNYLKKQKNEEQEKQRLEKINDLEKIKTELTKSIEEKIDKTLEKKLKTFYYWLFGVSLFLLIVIIGVFFYLRNSFIK